MNFKTMSIKNYSKCKTGITSTNMAYRKSHSKRDDNYWKPMQPVENDSVFSDDELAMLGYDY